MAETSLSAYQIELESLLSEDRYDEVIAHARHILKSQPKNLRAYQQLGDALAASGRWEEAGSVFRRALGAQPQDFHAHSQLARAFQNLGEYERAIWHAERALDQKPSDQEAIGRVRELYRVHRHEEIDRLQLTAAALAQQQIRGNLLTEALDTLATALENNPQRIDLQLLRARALWLDGQRMDAAETALDILDRLPYAIDANRIMTELWLTEQRPSDAQLYLERINDLDPYLAHQMATGEEAPEDLLKLERLDYNPVEQREDEIVNPEWLDTLGESRSEAAEADDAGGGLGALLGIDDQEQAPGEAAVTEGLDDLLSDEQIEALFSELVIGEPVAAVSEAPTADESESLLNAMEEQGFLDAAPPEPVENEDLQLFEDQDDVVEFVAQASAADDQRAEPEADDERAQLDDDLTDLLERLDTSEEDGDWMAEIQGGSLALEGDDESLEYLDDFEREWVKAGTEDDGGAPWLSAAMREAMDKNGDGDHDLFDGDEQLQNLLELGSDTEPLHMSDIEDWLTVEPDGSGDESGERSLDLEDELLHSPPGDSWLDNEEAGVGELPLSVGDEDPNQRNAELIEGWGAELGDDDDDDPYVDWLRDDPNELNDDELGIHSAPADDETAAPAQDRPQASAEERARAWGLDDPDQLADFVEDAGGFDSAPGWLNAVVPGLDRENDAASGDPNEYARPMSSPGKEFTWVSDLVDEETGQMKAVDPDQAVETPYFRFSNQPAWLLTMQERSGVNPALTTGLSALRLDEDIEALDLDDLTFDDFFNFDTPTDKLDAISLDEDTQRLSLASLDWDDYFDLESPTEKTIAITLDEAADELSYDAIGVDDANFEFEKAADDTQDAGADIDFSDIDLGDDLIADANQDVEPPPAWLNYDSLDGDNADDDDSKRNRAGDQTTL